MAATNYIGTYLTSKKIILRFALSNLFLRAIKTYFHRKKPLVLAIIIIMAHMYTHIQTRAHTHTLILQFYGFSFLFVIKRFIKTYVNAGQSGNKTFLLLGRVESRITFKALNVAFMRELKNFIGPSVFV